LKGETNLEKLLAMMSPELVDGEFVFCTIKDASYGDHAATLPIASFLESEGLTLVLKKAVAENAGLSFEAVFRCITLGVHSSLEAVGLTAEVASRLAEHGIAANVIAAYYHDHIFVQAALAENAIGILSTYKNN